MKKPVLLLVFGFLAILAAAAFIYLRGGLLSARSQRVMEFIRHPEAHRDWMVRAGQRCGNAPFQLPTDGYIGFLWDDSWKPGHHHQGLDIFAGTPAGLTPVYAAYDGYLTREAEWKSSLIVRIPSDPLQPGRPIWTYYTHLADADGHSLIAADFPAGTREVFVPAGTLLGYQGNFSGTPGAPVGVHLHFSIVLDDGNGRYRNELEIANTLDPSPYLGIPLNARTDPPDIPLCP